MLFIILASIFIYLLINCKVFLQFNAAMGDKLWVTLSAIIVQQKMSYGFFEKNIVGNLNRDLEIVI